MKLGKGAVKLANQPADRQHLTHGNGVEPDNRPATLALQSPNPPQPFCQTHAVLMRCGHLPQPPGSAGYQGRKQGEVVEKQDHA